MDVRIERVTTNNTRLLLRLWRAGIKTGLIKFTSSLGFLNLDRKMMELSSSRSLNHTHNWALRLQPRLISPKSGLC